MEKGEINSRIIRK